MDAFELTIWSADPEIDPSENFIASTVPEESLANARAFKKINQRLFLYENDAIDWLTDYARTIAPQSLDYTIVTIGAVDTIPFEVGLSVDWEID